MWQQCFTQGLQLQQAEPAETEERGKFLSFAKRSREVHRGSVCLPAPDLHHSSSLSQCGVEILSEKSACYNPCFGDTSNMFFTEPAEMVCTGVRDLSVDTLPSPAQLMGRRKKGRGQVQRGDAAVRQTAAVTRHIGDLRRNQSIIEQMKKEKCWGSTDAETRIHTQHTGPNPTHLNTSTVTSQVFAGCEEMMDLAPGGNPMMSFVVTGTAHRETRRNWDMPYVDTPFLDTPFLDTPFLDTPGPTHTEFWGFPSIIQD